VSAAFSVFTNENGCSKVNRGEQSEGSKAEVGSKQGLRKGCRLIPVTLSLREIMLYPSPNNILQLSAVLRATDVLKIGIDALIWQACSHLGRKHFVERNLVKFH
jgi:hypothetical protein